MTYQQFCQIFSREFQQSEVCCNLLQEFMRIIHRNGTDNRFTGFFSYMQPVIRLKNLHNFNGICKTKMLKNLLEIMHDESLPKYLQKINFSNIRNLILFESQMQRFSLNFVSICGESISKRKSSRILVVLTGYFDTR